MKYKILEMLKQNTQGFVSGEEISERLNVSRTAVWKCINQLRESGYVIESQTKNGYRLVFSPDSVAAGEILPLLNTAVIGRKILYFDSIDSTNLYAKKAAETDFHDGTVVVADEQTAGKGRLGRHWVSSKGKGVWMTIMLKPDIDPSDAAKTTLLAACAVCRAVEKCCGLAATIKWPNDVVYGGRKLCGILTEMSAEGEQIRFLIIGIGINANFNTDDFPEDLADVATSIKRELGMDIPRKMLAAEVINEFEAAYRVFISQNGNIRPFIEEYKKRSAVIGKDVRVIYKKEEVIGKAVDITEEGQLVILMQDGSRREILSGEVSVRGIYGYI